MIEYTCRVCGLITEDIRWDDFGCPTYIICDCCGAESGYQDMHLFAIRNHRLEWSDSGSNWKYSKFQPPNWNLEDQLQQIPTQFL